MMASACSRNTGKDVGTGSLWQSTALGLDNQPITLAKYQGRPLVVNFWARWCPPCRNEIPDFITTYRQFQAQGVELVGIGIEEKVSPVKEFAHTYGISYPLLLTQEEGYQLMAELGNKEGSLPFTIVIDRQGHIVAYKIGQMSKAQMATAFSAALR
jgi:peroxiredoxin